MLIKLMISTCLQYEDFSLNKYVVIQGHLKVPNYLKHIIYC